MSQGAIQTGARGGRYILTKSGKKMYLSEVAQRAHETTQQAKQEHEKATKERKAAAKRSPKPPPAPVIDSPKAPAGGKVYSMADAKAAIARKAWERKTGITRDTLPKLPTHQEHQPIRGTSSKETLDAIKSLRQRREREHNRQAEDRPAAHEEAKRISESMQNIRATTLRAKRRDGPGNAELERYRDGDGRAGIKYVVRDGLYHPPQITVHHDAENAARHFAELVGSEAARKAHKEGVERANRQFAAPPPKKKSLIRRLIERFQP